MMCPFAPSFFAPAWTLLCLLQGSGGEDIAPFYHKTHSSRMIFSNSCSETSNIRDAPGQGLQSIMNTPALAL